MPAVPTGKLLFNYTAENGEHYMGIPGRDIYADEYERMSDEQKDLLKASPYYKHAAAVRAEVKAEEKAEAKKP